MIETPKTITVPLTLRITASQARWAEEFGLGAEEVAADIATYYGSSEIAPAHLVEEGTVVSADRRSWSTSSPKGGRVTVVINLDVVVDREAWNLNFGTGTGKTAVARDVRNYWSNDFLPSYLTAEGGIVSSARAAIGRTAPAKAADRTPYPTAGDPMAPAPSYLKFRR